MPFLRVGIDCGGTNTDAVVLGPDDRVLGWAKRPASQDVLSGVVAALAAALEHARQDPSAVAAAMLGTTQFVNAATQLQGLERVAVVRLCGPATRALPPFCDMPPALRAAVGGCYILAAAPTAGGYEYDGRSEIAPLDEAQLRAAARRIVAAGIRCAVVSAVFSPVRADQEQRAARVLQEEAAEALREAVAGGASEDGTASCSALPAGASHGSEARSEFFVCQSHEVGQLGLLERENAAVLNAALLPLARRIVPACTRALAAVGIAAPLLFSGNDGTLLTAERALQFPIATFQSGPVNSLRGAALLSGLRHAAVVDIGGTTTDVGVLVGGLPCPAPRTLRFAGAPTNFQAPDVESIGLGGGSRVRFSRGGGGGGGGGEGADTDHGKKGAAAAAQRLTAAASLRHEEPAVGAEALGAAACREAEGCSVGPDSVGAALSREALSLGGGTCTASDVAVVLDRMQLGSRQAAAAALPPERAEAAWRVIQRRLEECLDCVKTHAGDVPVVVVGGGAPLCGETLRGASTVVVPPHAAVANAVGAAAAQVSGTVDVVRDMGGTEASRIVVMEAAEQEAARQAVAAGAAAGSCWVASREEVPLAYLPGNTSRVTVKAVGDLDLASLQRTERGGSGSPSPDREGEEQASGEASTPLALPPFAAEELELLPGGHKPAGAPAAEGWPPLPGRGEDPTSAQLAGWRPQVAASGAWLLHEPDLHLIATGAGILGCGGGGSPGRALLKALMQLKGAGVGSMRVVAPAAVPDDALVADAGYMGAPTVGLEKLDSNQAEAAVHAVLEAYRGTVPALDADTAAAGGQRAPGGRSGDTAGVAAIGEGPGGAVAAPAASAAPLHLAAIMAGEVGGGNGLEPLVVGSRLGLPVVDGDLMGRAFPELQMMTTAIHGLPILPAAVADEKGCAVVVQRAPGPAWLERLLRPLCTEMGCSAGFSCRPLTGSQLRSAVVPHSLSLAWRLGAAAAAALHEKRNAAAAIAAAGGGRVLFRGKVADVQRQTTRGFARGRLLLEGGGAHAGTRLLIDFQNENLVAAEQPSGRVLAAVPDLICCVEAQSGQPVATEEQRYGLRLAVLALPAHPLLTTLEALAVVGPAAFGHEEVRYVPVAQYVPPKPIPVHVLPAAPQAGQQAQD